MSAEDKAKANEAYLTEWLRLVQPLIPEVQKQREIAACDVSGAAALDRNAPPEIVLYTEQSLTRRLDMLKQALPIPIDFYGSSPQSIITSTSTANASSSTAIFTSLVELQSGTRALPDVDAAVKRYLEVQEKQDRVNDARSRLARHMAHLVLVFNQAEQAFAEAQVSVDYVPKAAAEMRTLIEKLKGELMVLARRDPRENRFPWQTMAERLTVGRDPSLRDALIDEERHFKHLWDELTALFKRNVAPSTARLSAARAGVVNHIYVVCGCL